MKAVVLAAGEGTRMWPLAETRPKHLLPIAGKPLIGHVLSALAENSVDKVFMITGFRGEMTHQMLGDGGKYGISLEYLRQEKLTGTASALKVASGEVRGEKFLTLYGDLMIDAHAVSAVVDKSRDCNTVMGVVKMENPSEYGVVDRSDDKIVRIAEKPSMTSRKQGWVNSGVYVLGEEALGAIEKTKPSKRGEYELTSSLQMMIERGDDVRCVEVDADEWMDVGRPWDLLTANQRALLKLRKNIKGTVEAGVTLKGPVWLEENATVKSGSYVEGPVYVGRGSEVGPNARVRPFTSVEDDVVVGMGCDVKNSVIMKGTKIPHLSYVGDSIIGEDCNLGAGTMTANLRFDEESVRMRINERLYDTQRRKLGVIMGDRVKTGVNSSFMPGVRIGSESYIGAGVVLFDDVDSAKKIVVKQRFLRSGTGTRRKRV